MRQPFQIADGRARLLAAYNERASHEVMWDDLRFFELALHVRWARRVEQRDGSLAAIARLLRGA